jgi:hypothetical protein
MQKSFCGEYWTRQVCAVWDSFVWMLGLMGNRNILQFKLFLSSGSLVTEVLSINQCTNLQSIVTVLLLVFGSLPTAQSAVLANSFHVHKYVFIPHKLDSTVNVHGVTPQIPRFFRTVELKHGECPRVDMAKVHTWTLCKVTTVVWDPKKKSSFLFLNIDSRGIWTPVSCMAVQCLTTWTTENDYFWFYLQFIESQ